MDNRLYLIRTSHRRLTELLKRLQFRLWVTAA